MRRFLLIALPVLALVRVYDYFSDGRNGYDLMAALAFALMFAGTAAEGRGEGAQQQARWLRFSRVALFAGIAAFAVFLAMRYRLLG